MNTVPVWMPVNLLVEFQLWTLERWGPVAPFDRHWFTATMGLSGEVGECIEHMKKHWRDGKVPNRELLLEFGDVLHYLTILARSYGWTLEEVIQANMDKLNERDRIKRERQASEAVTEAGYGTQS